eukprot:6620485-Alexandrium_andersonii.AAC.1
MGGLVVPDADPTPEVKARVSASKSAVGPMRKGVLAAPRLPAQVRVSLLDSLAGSRLLHNVHVLFALQ